MVDKTEADSVTALAKLADNNVPAVVFERDDGRTFVARRNDFALDQITPANKAEVFMPKIVTQAVTIETADSLCDYVNRFKNDDSVIFANISSNKIVAVIDYHGEPVGLDRREAHATSRDGSTPDPRLLAHRATFQLAFSEQWTVWKSRNEKLMTQVEFADFLEQNGVDVTDPPGADLLEIIADLDAFSKSTIKTRVRMGAMQNVSFSKDSDVTGSKDGDMAIPNRLRLSIPIYFGEGPVTIDALIRMTVDDGTAAFGYKLIRPEQTRQIEFQRIVDSIASETATTTVYGAIGGPIPV